MSAAKPRMDWYGRLIAKDARDHKFLMKPDKKEAAKTDSRSWAVGAGMPLNQGATPQCVAYSGFGYLLTSPIRNRPKFKPKWLYDNCQQADEWPGEDYDGTSVRALFKVLKREGYCSGYEWAFSFAPILAQVLTVGPVVLGTDWMAGMDEPGPGGYIWPAGENLGGHAWLLVGANRNRKNPDRSVGAFRMMNSWGDDWGAKGRAWITFAAVDELIKADGEACTSVEVLK
ncbi:MAG: hypothetical protein ACREIB_09935 [Pseudomonadota bacterium]